MSTRYELACRDMETLTSVRDIVSIETPWINEYKNPLGITMYYAMTNKEAFSAEKLALLLSFGIPAVHVMFGDRVIAYPSEADLVMILDPRDMFIIDRMAKDKMNEE